MRMEYIPVGLLSYPAHSMDPTLKNEGVVRVPVHKVGEADQGGVHAMATANADYPWCYCEPGAMSEI